MKGPKSRGIQLGRGLGILGALCIVVALLAFIIHFSAFNKAEAALGESLASRITTEIESRLALKVALGQRIASALEANPSLSEAQLSSMASTIIDSDRTVAGIIIAPGAIVKFHFPLTEGESLIGHDLLSNPERRDSLVKAAETKGAIIAGPYETVDGKRIGFIRYPVYSGEKLWGFASITFDFASFYDSLGLARDFPDLKIGLFMGEPRDSSPLYKIAGEEGRGIFRHSRSMIRGYGLSWVLVLSPRSGWGWLDFSLIVLFVMAIIPSLALIALYFFSGKIKKSTEHGDGEHIEVTPPAKPIEMEFPSRSQTSDKDDEEGKGDFLDFEEMAKKKGRKLRFQGPSVRGALYMPERGNSKIEPEAVELPVMEPAANISPASKISPAADMPVVDKNPVLEPEKAIVLGPLFHEARASILVVDDSEVNRDLVGHMLNLRGYQADFADSGLAALARCREASYDLIFLDCFMPGIDGYKTSVLLREENPRRKTRIVGMSARIGPKELETCKAAGMDDVLAKPFTAKQLYESLERNTLSDAR
jgi:CheY-like chemotaxis protein